MDGSANTLALWLWRTLPHSERDAIEKRARADRETTRDHKLRDALDRLILAFVIERSLEEQSPTPRKRPEPEW
jgi:hypothetical protein